MKVLALQAVNCISCGAALENFQGVSETTCNYCGTVNKIVKPVSVDRKKAGSNLDTKDKKSFENICDILEKSMVAGNYNEAYEYCNKGLELDPTSSDLWSNKAVCAFWKSMSLLSEDKISNTNAREITTFLAAAKDADPDNEHYKETANSISDNLYIVTKFKLDNYTALAVKFNLAFVAYGANSLIDTDRIMTSVVKDYLDLIETSYDIAEDKNTEILKSLISEIKGHTARKYVTEANFFQPPSKDSHKETNLAHHAKIRPFLKVDMLVGKIKKEETDYVDNIEWKGTPQWVKYFMIACVIFFIIVMILS